MGTMRGVENCSGWKRIRLGGERSGEGRALSSSVGH